VIRYACANPGSGHDGSGGEDQDDGQDEAKPKKRGRRVAGEYAGKLHMTPEHELRRKRGRCSRSANRHAEMTIRRG
jgi:hypothetical protein